MIHLSAAQLGAPHKRDRIWILARRSPDPDSGRCKEQRVAQHGDVEGQQRDQPDRLGASGRWPREDASADALQLSFWHLEQRKAGDGTRFKTAGKPSLETLASRSGGKLSPRWVEWLMGFPEGWASCEASETLRCRLLEQWLSRF